MNTSTFFKGLWNLTGNELKLYYGSPLAYLLGSVFLFISGFFFVLILKSSQDASLMRYVFSNTSVILLLLGPLIAMNLIAEERKNNTLPLLLSSPIYTAQIVLGKYLAALILLAFFLLCTLHYPLFLMVVGQPDLSAVASGYIGLFLMGSVFVGLGLLTSVWFKNATLAASSAFGASLMLWFLGAGPQSSVSSEVFQNTWSRAFSLHAHQESFLSGWWSAADLVFYLSIIALLAALGTFSLSLQRWSRS